MIPSFAVATLGLLFAAGEPIRWSAAVQTQLRARDEPSADNRAELGEIDLRGRFGLLADVAAGAAALTYTPRVLLQQVFSGSPMAGGNATQHGGQLQLETRLAPTTRLTSRTSVEWGRTDYSPLSGTPIPGAVNLPSQRFVHTLGVDTMLDLAHAFSRRLRMSVGAGFRRSGGVGHDAIQILPYQVGPQATAALEWNVDRANALRVVANLAESRFAAQRFIVLSNFLAEWRLRASRQVVFDAAAGGAHFRTSDAQIVSYPAGSLGLAWESPPRVSRALRASLRIRLSPGINPFTEQATEALRGEASSELSEGRLRIAVDGTGGYAVRGADRGARDYRLGVRALWGLTRAWSLEGGLRAAWTNQVPFRGWQGEPFIGLRWADVGAL